MFVRLKSKLMFKAESEFGKLTKNNVIWVIWVQELF